MFGTALSVLASILIAGWQEVIRLVFQKFQELGSARQVLLWMASENIHFPYPSNGRTLTSFEWRPIRYRNVISILKNPFYAGVYAYGKSEKRTEMILNRASDGNGDSPVISMRYAWKGSFMYPCNASA